MSSLTCPLKYQMIWSLCTDLSVEITEDNGVSALTCPLKYGVFALLRYHQILTICTDLSVKVPEDMMGRGGGLDVALDEVGGAAVHVHLLLPLHPADRL